MIHKHAEWCRDAQHTLQQDVTLLSEATERWRLKVDDMIASHQREACDSIGTLLDKWNVFCKHYTKMLPHDSDSFDMSETTEHILGCIPEYVDMSSMVHQFTSHWFYTSNVNMEPLDVNIMMILIDIRRMNKDIVEYMGQHDPAPKETLCSLIDEKQAHTQRIRATIQECSLDKRPHRIWINTCYMFLPLFIDAESKLFNILITATHMHNSINQLQLETLTSLLRNVDRGMRRHVHIVKNVFRERMEPFVHNSIMIQNIISGREHTQPKQEHHSGIDVANHITDGLALNVFTSIHKLLHDPSVRTVLENAKQGKIMQLPN
jgi:hypothetical protein